MSNPNGRDSGGALDSVRQLERTLADRQESEKTAEKRLDAARQEAERIVAEAQREGEEAAVERRRQVLADADGRAERILQEARAEAEELRARAARDRASAAGAVVGWVLPDGETGSTA